MRTQWTIKICWLAAVICGAVPALMASTPTYGSTKVALVLETNGTSVPLVQPYSEIAAGTTVSLPHQASLVFLHYAACRTATVVGGAITFDVGTYSIAGGSERSAVRGQCPRVEVVRPRGETAGVLLRQGPRISLTLSPQPNFVLIGERANDFAFIQVAKGGQALMQTALAGRRFRWPTGTAPLTSDTVYELILIPRVVGTTHVSTTFRVKTPNSYPSSDELILVRVE